MDRNGALGDDSRQIDDLETVIEWARFSRGATRWHDVESVLDQPAPSDVVEAMTRLRDTELCAGAGPPPLDVLNEWQQGLDVRESDILRHRLLALGPGRKTLDAIGQAHGITRERVRQLETRLLTRFRDKLGDPRFRTVRWALFQLEAGLGAFAPDTEVPLGAESSDEADAFRLLLHIGGYVHDEDLGAIRKSTFSLPKTEDLPLIDEGPILDDAALEHLLVNRGVTPAHLPFAIGHLAKVRRLDDSLVLWPGNIARKGVAVLTVRGRPMTPDEIADVINEDFNRRGFRDRIFNEPRAMRSSRHHVALRVWGLPEYGGVVPAMVARLADGPVVLAELADELATQYKISPNSVVMYGAAPIFRTGAGKIELRPDGALFIPTNAPWKVSGLYRHDTDRLAWHLRIDHDILRGSGRSVPDEIGIFLAGTPPMSLKLKTSGKDIPFNWAETSHVGPSIGSIRELASSVDGQEGDLLRLVFDRAERSISAQHVDTSTEGEHATALARLTGLGASHLTSQAAFAYSLGVADDGGDTVGLLRARDDQAVADLVAALPRR